ncbi:coiled-coil domain-containing protein 186-like isoform X1 [Hylaeus anthracinus]|uniref:coiled-coil domain-containing protein 186-like isoform X1 n=1 Tax=Hylaeus anthracinus TaxID=313031 RepID=UPI0023B980C2|nr:coiled-coil domain-containing protein 186-like isoform X1 [Hylaeus anthracinus]XP_053998073.1 coiled-coil domain-containing protein 186-like isoform X1 [Hylaeus anthracinus]
MEFTLSEMDEEKSESCSKDETFSGNLDQIDSSITPDVSLAEVTNSLIQSDVKISKDTTSVQEKLEQVAQTKTDSVLVNNNGKSSFLIEENSIILPIKSSTSLSDLSNDFSKCQTLSKDADLLKEKPLLKSSSYGDVRLSNTVSDNVRQPRSEHEESIAVCNEDEETLFSTKLYMDTQQTHFLEKNVIQNEIQNALHTGENVVQNSNMSNKLMELNDPTNDSKQKSQSIENTRSQSNIIVRPTLADDSKLVKISLPTNPINIMQSNAQFLNKSRNFLNFITEKSTNIMEKALLPQHLTVKYNSVMKSIDNYNEKKYVEEPCSTKSPLKEPTFRTESNLMDKTNAILYPSKSSMGLQNERDSCTKDSENKITLTNTHDETHVNTEKNDKNNDDISDCIQNNTNQVEAPITDKSNEQNDNVLCMEANGNCTDTDSMVIISEGNNNSSENLKLSLLKHPAYLTLLKDYADLKTKYLKFQEKVEYVEERNRMLEAENKGEIYSVQIDNLEKTINKLTFELHTSLATQETLKKEYNAANKERESMVMKYAVSEKQLIDTQRAREYAERKAKESGKQQELLQSKLREMQGERTRICNILDGRCREVTELQKEVEKLKEDVNMRDIKLKWTQNKLKTEMDLQKETQQKLDKATTRISEMKEECEQIRKETQESMRQFQQSEENKAVTLDQQLKEQQARLILERHVTEDKEMLRLQLQKEVETLKHRQQVLIEENNTLSLKIQDTEQKRSVCESNLDNLKILADQRQKEIIELHGKVSELETLKVQLQQKNQCLDSIESEMEHLRLANEELQADMSACRQKEADMLDFTQKLTDKNVRLQSEFTAIEAKVKHLEENHGPLHERISYLTGKIKTLEESLAKEQKMRIEECEILARHLAEQTQLAQNLAQKLEDSQGENAVLKRKQQLSMKEMTRELQQCRKKLEAFETSSPYNSLGIASRTGSSISLNTGDTLNGALSDNSINGDQSIQSMEPSKQTLIDRIIKLQEDNAKKAEKLDFFEEHTRTLVEELQKKTRIIQTYILHENTGAMGNNERDKYKHIKSRRNAAELARHGGIMASVYNQRVSDDNMTLELSLEINQKLQAVLEDALFKNITLKDNIDTLGEEIARLTIHNQQRKIAN